MKKLSGKNFVRSHTCRTIDSLLEHTKGTVENSIPAAKADSSYLLSWDGIKQVYESIANGVKDGHIVARLRDTMKNAYQNHLQESSLAKALARLQATTLDGAKYAVTQLAKAAGESDHYLERIKE